MNSCDSFSNVKKVAAFVYCSNLNWEKMKKLKILDIKKQENKLT